MDWIKLRKRYAHHRNLLSRGHTEVSLYYSAIQLGLIVWLTIRDAVTVHREWVVFVIPGLFLMAVMIQYAIGWAMERTNMIDELQKWDLQRSPQIQQLLERSKDQAIREEAEFWMKTE